YLVDGEDEEAHLTYAELDRWVRAIGALLQEHSRPGDRVLLLYHPGLDFPAAIFGCLYAGVVAVPTYPPRPGRYDRVHARLQGIAASARPSVVLTTSNLLPSLRDGLANSPGLESARWLSTDDLSLELAGDWRPPSLASDTLALFQYTSGSTAAPKGVMVSQGNLLHNASMIWVNFEHTPASRGVMWVPPHHDLGLLGGLLHPVYGGVPVVLMSPLHFLQQPMRWLRAVSRYRATTSGGPNFAYDLCVRATTPEQRASLDLSAWEIAFNAAEPVSDETMERFATAFAPAGFRARAFDPVYGLAEATAFVSSSRRSAPPVVRSFDGSELQRGRAVPVAADAGDAHTLTGCGRTTPDQRIVVAEPVSAAPCPPDEIGEIWLSGPSVAQGYWDRPEDTAQTFGAYLSNREGPFLRTGDLGFVLDGELFITGRLKDLIVIRGRNHYPQDLERTVEQSHPALRPSCGATFSVLIDGEEHLVVAQELERHYRKPDADEVFRAIRRALAEEHGLAVRTILLLRTGSLPKTPSGKVQRLPCRDAYLAGTLPVLFAIGFDSPS
ncbi:MAG: fatty acyl-AMP ligase, partial [Chloroflexi bacterium]|nr:fatty acyl-AMP ligase [Chloroflexota bacterium]